jgi:HEAT repeat protein
VSDAVDPRERASVLEDLASTDDEVRRLAVERALGLPPVESLPVLAERLGDPSWRVRKAAVECLAALPEDAPAAAHLVAALADGENPGRRNAAVEALIRIGRRAIDPLLAASASPDVDVRKLVVDALAGIGSERALPRLAELLADPDPNVRGAAADALAAIGGDEASRALVGAALEEGEDPLVRFAALRGLARLEAPLTAHELGSALADPLLRPVAFGVLGRVADRAGEEILLKSLEADSRATREAAIEALLRIVGEQDSDAAHHLIDRMRAVATADSVVVEDAIGRLADGGLATRLLLAQFLGAVAAPNAVLPLLRAACEDEAIVEVALGALVALGPLAEAEIEAAWDLLNVDLRVLACEVLARSGSGREGVRLVAALDEADPALRIAAARAIAARGDVGAVPALLRRLQAGGDDSDFEAEDERAALIEALVRVASAPHARARRYEVTSALADSFEGASEPVRLAIARVFAAVGCSEHASLMALLLQDPSAAVRRASVAAFADVPAPARREALRLALADESAGVRIAAAAALGAGADPAALEDLERLLGDDDAEVRAAAVRAIAELAVVATPSWTRVGERLAGALQDCGPVVLAAIEAFERVAPAVSLEPVRAALGHADPEVVQGALRCIRRHGSEADLGALVPLLAHPHWAVRAGAIEAIAERQLRAALPAVLRRLDGEDDEFVRGALLRALERLEEA